MIALKSSHFRKIEKDMKKESMLSDAEIHALAQKVNIVVNLPFVKEEKELIVFTKVIKKLDTKLYDLLPNEYYELIRDASDGISPEEAERIEERLTTLINGLVNVPVLSEKQEGKLIGLVLGLIIGAMVKGVRLEENNPS